MSAHPFIVTMLWLFLASIISNLHDLVRRDFKPRTPRSVAIGIAINIGFVVWAVAVLLTN